MLSFVNDARESETNATLIHPSGAKKGTAKSAWASSGMFILCSEHIMHAMPLLPFPGKNLHVLSY